MALLNQSVQVYGKLGELFAKLLEGQAPDKFTREFLKDIGFKSSNWHAAINLLKGLGFLSADGSPTRQYMELLDKTRWQTVLAKAVRDAYSDIFIMKREPGPSDVQMIAGKYKSTYNLSDTAADRAARTFLALLDLSDKDAILDGGPEKEVDSPDDKRQTTEEQRPETTPSVTPPRSVGLAYNIQIHLPATKDIEVYNAIFKSLREHIIG